MYYAKQELLDLQPPKHAMSIHDIAAALYRAGLIPEYQALKSYITERDALLLLTKERGLKPA